MKQCKQIDRVINTSKKLIRKNKEKLWEIGDKRLLSLSKLY